VCRFVATPLREDFTSTVSHDLRNPLTVARGQLELLASEVESDRLDPLDRSLTRMDTLIDETLALARQGRTVAETERVELLAVCERCWARVATGEATLRVVTDGPFRADASRVEQVFENLFRNAIDHGGAAVTVRVGHTADGFYVADDGPGIPPGERADVFESGVTTSEGGTGYGLAIVEEIASAHGWNVAVTGSESGGARFEFVGVTFVE